MLLLPFALAAPSLPSNLGSPNTSTGISTATQNCSTLHTCPTTGATPEPENTIVPSDERLVRIGQEGRVDLVALPVSLALAGRRFDGALVGPVDGAGDLDLSGERWILLEGDVTGDGVDELLAGAFQFDVDAGVLTTTLDITRGDGTGAWSPTYALDLDLRIASWGSAQALVPVWTVQTAALRQGEAPLWRVSYVPTSVELATADLRYVATAAAVTTQVRAREDLAVSSPEGMVVTTSHSGVVSSASSSGLVVASGHEDGDVVVVQRSAAGTARSFQREATEVEAVAGVVSTTTTVQTGNSRRTTTTSTRVGSEDAPSGTTITEPVTTDLAYTAYPYAGTSDATFWPSIEAALSPR